MESTISDRVIRLACQIQQIPAPTFAEAQRAAFIQACFIAEGLSDVSTDALGNVFARLPGRSGALPLVVSAHQDTVFPLSTDLTLTRTPDRISAPGIGDNALGVASLLGLVWSLHDLPRDIWLVANVCEEGLGNLLGIKAVVERFGKDAAAYIVVEGMSLGQVYHRGLGVQRYRIRVSTRGGHAWVDYGKPSAIHELAEIAVQLNQLPIPSQPRSSLNIGVIQGGTSINTIAAEASLDLDIRSESETTLLSLSQQVEEIVLQVHRNAPHPVHSHCELIGQRPAGSLPADHPLVALAVSCLGNLGVPARLNTGSTDINYPLSYGFPAICVGITTGGGAHTTAEFIHTHPVELGLQQLARLVEMACQELS